MKNDIKQKKIKILHVVNSYFAIPYFLGKQLLYFKKQGYEEHIICSPSNEIEANAHKLGYHYVEVDIKRKISIISDIKALIRSVQYIKAEGINIVNGHTPKGALIGLMAGWFCKVPKRFYFRHGLVFETSKGLKKSLLIIIDRLCGWLSTQIINVSPSVSSKSMEYHLNPEYKQIILHKGTCNGIPIKKFSLDSIDPQRKLSYLASLGLKDGSFTIGYTGRLVCDKGIVELVKAFTLLQNRGYDIQLLLVGMFEERDSLPESTKQEILNNAGIIYTGYVDYNIIEYYYSLMDIYVLPSYREGFPTSVLEASAMELPILTTISTGCVDSIIENKTGKFVLISPDSIADNILYLFKSHKTRKEYGRAGREFVIKNFRQEIIWKEIEKLYSAPNTNRSHKCSLVYNSPNNQCTQNLS